MSITTITPSEANDRVQQGAILVDIREADEYAREHIPGARHVPLSKLDQAELAADGQTIILHCRSGARTQNNSARLAAKANGRKVFMIAGGLDAWSRAGLPTVIDRRRPIEMQRQVQIVAGALVAIGTALGLEVSPWLLGVPLFVGCGLLFAGVSGFCGMARLLAWAPWNRATASA